MYEYIELERLKHDFKMNCREIRRHEKEIEAIKEQNKELYSKIRKFKTGEFE